MRIAVSSARLDRAALREHDEFKAAQRVRSPLLERGSERAAAATAST
jgi:hypothetical protein